ncbi:unnamed protein product [Amaranthus hypochondriacus]
MDTHRSPLLGWPYYYQGKNMEELKHSLVCTTLELETTRLTAQEEIRKREEQLNHLQELLNKAISERDLAEQNYKTLILEKLILQQQIKQNPNLNSGSSSSIEDEQQPITQLLHTSNLSSSDTEESMISSPTSRPQPPPQPSIALPERAIKLLSGKKPLPEKGNLLQAVIKAGPLLQTLLLAGPLPEWRHPPPPLESFEIPPVGIDQDEMVINGSNFCGILNRKRGFSCDVFDGCYNEGNKYQRVLLH